MATEFRSFIAEAMSSWNLGSTSLVMMSRSMNCPTTPRRRWCTRSSAAMSSGSASRNRSCISMSYRNGSSAPPQSFAIDQREEQERQPSKHAEEDDPPLHEFESRGSEPRTHQKLEQGPSQNEREIRQFVRTVDLFLCGFHCCALSVF